MTQEIPTIYRARNLQEAYLLSQALEAEGIRTTVTNGVLEGGSGVDVLGWATYPRVQVLEKDAVRAREIALEFDRRLQIFKEDILDAPVEESSSAMVEESDLLRTPGSSPSWPCCPKCGAKRWTSCEFCGTSGDDFPPAYSMENELSPTDSFENATTCEGDHSSCCNSGSCGSQGIQEHSSHEGMGHRQENRLSNLNYSPQLICPTCDEPFTPEYFPNCESCGYSFVEKVEDAESSDLVEKNQAAVANDTLENEESNFIISGLLLGVSLGIILFLVFMLVLLFRAFL